MTPRLLLVVALWAVCVSCTGSEGDSHLRVQCRAFRYPIAIDCSWTQPPAPNSSRLMSFITTYRLGVAPEGESRPCLQPTPETPRCAIPEVQMFSLVPYVLNVTAVHPSGVSSTLLAFIPEHIIKSDPPESVHLSPIPGKQLRIQWDPPRSWPFPEIFRLQYWIRYKRHGASRFQKVGPMEDTSFTLRPVRPEARYCVQVAAKDLLGYGELSDWSSPAMLPIPQAR
ncbi:PREDICTED: interleukin-27 subunit beta [Chrysochloris asiatica]|uniref:Interleukin-27 subunit beta n=1 Tax=Chrysochloris asiatica TaxID=185453 RepID=A0A9B0TUS6_CHRAS|nr:PREDICTED: interleukin-27 subunit beta [Chrysochloris asiatica]